ncbi:MAG: DUF4366 domain-containing protein [Candidatus Onthomonas sp.]
MKNNTFRWLRRMVALLLCLCLVCAGLTSMALAVETEPETPPEETMEEGPSESTEEPVEEPEELAAELEYQVQVDDIPGYYNEPVDLTIRLEDVDGTGWQKVEASLSQDDPEQRTDLTEALLLDSTATYTVSDNCTVYFFITDMEGTEHTETYIVSCFDFDPPKVQAGIRGSLLRVEANDILSGVSGIYVNDRLYTTLEDGVLDLRIDNCTDELLFFIQAVDRLGNESGYVVLSNPFYEEPMEEVPEEKPAAEEDPDQDCPKDCDCRNQTVETTPTQPVASSAPLTGTSTTTGTVENPSAAQSGTTASTEETKADEPMTIEPGEGFTENGSAVTRDLLYDKYTNKQFITVETRNGETFYLVIDYDKPTDEEGEQYETYFMNLVDEADLAALLDDGTEPVCTCTVKCQPGAVNTSCEICRNDLYDCACLETVTEEPEKPEPEPEPESEPDPEPQEPEQEKKTNLILPVLLLLTAAGGGAVWFFKFRKNKPDTRGPVDLDDYDYGEDDDTEYETETEAEDESTENE